MIEVLPNWHPVFVHFTIALLSMAVIFNVLKIILPSGHHYQKALTILAKSNLYIGLAFALITAIAGWFAYNSVNHDTPSHLAMTEHRNIALITLALFAVLTLWSLFLKSKTSILFVILMVVAGGALSATGWMGAEAVYRYGLGVMSMPKVSGEGHAHQHPDGQGHGDKMTMHKESKPHEHAKGEEHDDAPTNTPDHDKNTSEAEHHDHDSTPHDHPAKATEPSVSSHDATPHTH